MWKSFIYLKEKKLAIQKGDFETNLILNQQHIHSDHHLLARGMDIEIKVRFGKVSPWARDQLAKVKERKIPAPY